MTEEVQRELRRMEEAGEQPSKEFLARTPAALQALQSDVQTRFGVTLADVGRAQAEHTDDAEVVELATLVHKLLVGEDGVRALERAAADVPADMTADKFYVLFLRQIEIVDEAFQDAVQKARAAPHSNRNLYLDKIVEDMVPAISERVQAELGLSDAQFHSCMLHYLQRDARCVEALQASQQRQQALRASLVA